MKYMFFKLVFELGKIDFNYFVYFLIFKIFYYGWFIFDCFNIIICIYFVGYMINNV